MSSTIEKLRALLERQSPPDSASTGAALDEKAAERLMRLLCETRDDELSCEEVFNCLDEYVDCLAAYQNMGGKKPLVEHHLNLCTDCRDQLDALVHALETATAENGGEETTTSET